MGRLGSSQEGRRKEVVETEFVLEKGRNGKGNGERNR